MVCGSMMPGSKTAWLIGGATETVRFFCPTSFLPTSHHFTPGAGQTQQLSWWISHSLVGV